MDFQTNELKNYEKGMEKRTCAVFDITASCFFDGNQKLFVQARHNSFGKEMHLYTEKLFMLCGPVRTRPSRVAKWDRRSGRKRRPDLRERTPGTAYFIPPAIYIVASQPQCLTSWFNLALARPITRATNLLTCMPQFIITSK